MKARRRRFAGLTSGSIKPTVAGAFIASAMMLLAGCGGSGGSAAESSAPAIRGDVALPDTSDPGNSAVTSPFDPEVIEGIQNVVANSVGKYRYWGPFGPGNDALVTVSEAYDTLAAAEMACAWAAQLGVDCLTVVGADN